MTVGLRPPKWLISAPLIFLFTLATTALLPVLLPLSLLLSALPALRGCLRAVLFFVAYLYCETIGILVSFYLWLTKGRNSETFLQGNFKLQCWWAQALRRSAARLFDLKFHLHNAACLDGPAALVFPRHTSVGDTVLPMVYYAQPQQIRLRYVLKSELLWDPCLEIVGNRLANYFVNRDSRNSTAEIDGVISLLHDIPTDEGILLYPEGTRYTAAKHAKLIQKSLDKPELQDQLRRWPALLPPRLGGSLGLLKNNPQRDLVFIAHTGFEGSANFAQLINGAWAHTHVHLEFWRVAYADIPTDLSAQREFFFQQWDRMQSTVDRLAKLSTDSA